MKVLLVNGSPHLEGSTFRALMEIGSTLEKNGIETEIFQIGSEPISSCNVCSVCRDSGACVIEDVVNEFVEKAEMADGLIFGSPVHYAGISGSLKAFLDRAFFANKSAKYRGKLGAGIVVCRRGGATAAFDQLNKYFTISQMPIVSSQYWNMVHASIPEDVEQDLEGLQTMRVIGNNMAWLLKCIEAGKAAGITMPEQEPREVTNFTR